MPHRSSHAPHKQNISKKEITELPLRSYTGSIHLIDSDAKMDAAALALREEKVLGFQEELVRRCA